MSWTDNCILQSRMCSKGNNSCLWQSCTERPRAVVCAAHGGHGGPLTRSSCGTSQARGWVAEVFHVSSAACLCFLPTGTSLVQHLMTVLISEQGRIFAVPQADVPGSQLEIRPVRQRSTVEWISEEDGEDGRSENSIPSPADLPSSNAVSLEATPGPVVKNAPSEHSGKLTQPATGPNKRGQTLPPWKYSFRQQGARSVSPKLGSSSLDIPNLSSSGNWLMNGLYSLRGHRRTASGERVKDSCSSQRLSTYDNVPSSSLSLSTHSMASTTWSTSSCEISVLDSVSSCPACRASDSSALSSLKTEWMTQGSLSQGEVKTADLENSTDRLEACSSSSEQSILAAASRDSVKCSRGPTELGGGAKDRTEQTEDWVWN